MNPERYLLIALWEPSQQLLQDLLQFVYWLGPGSFSRSLNTTQAWGRRDGGGRGHVWTMGANKGTQARAISPMGARQGRGGLAGLRKGRVQDRERQGTGICTGHNHGHRDLPNGEGHPRSQRGTGLKHLEHEVCLQRVSSKGRERKEDNLETEGHSRASPHKKDKPRFKLCHSTGRMHSHL